MRRNFRPVLRPILRPDFRPSHKHLSPQFRSGESQVRRNMFKGIFWGTLAFLKRTVTLSTNAQRSPRHGSVFKTRVKLSTKCASVFQTRTWAHLRFGIARFSTSIRKILVSVKCLSAILGPQMAASILWTPGIFAFFLQENLHVHKIPRFRGGYLGFFLGGECRLYFYGRGAIFLTLCRA